MAKKPSPEDLSNFIRNALRTEAESILYPAVKKAYNLIDAESSRVQKTFFKELGRYMGVEEAPAFTGSWTRLSKRWLAKKSYYRGGKPDKRSLKRYRNTARKKRAQGLSPYKNEFYLGLTGERGYVSKKGPQLKGSLMALNPDTVLGKPQIITEGNVTNTQRDFRSMGRRFFDFKQTKAGVFRKNPNETLLDVRISVKLFSKLLRNGVGEDQYLDMLSLAANQAEWLIPKLEGSRPLFVPYLYYFIDRARARLAKIRI